MSSALHVNCINLAVSRITWQMWIDNFLLYGHYPNIIFPTVYILFKAKCKNIGIFYINFGAVRVNLIRLGKSESIDGIVFPSGLSSRCREIDTLDSAHAPAKLCTNYSTCAFLCRSSISALQADCAKFMSLKLRWNVIRTVLRQNQRIQVNFVKTCF